MCVHSEVLVFSKEFANGQMLSLERNAARPRSFQLDMTHTTHKTDLKGMPLVSASSTQTPAAATVCTILMQPSKQRCEHTWIKEIQ